MFIKVYLFVLLGNFIRLSNLSFIALGRKTVFYIMYFLVILPGKITAMAASE